MSNVQKFKTKPVTVEAIQFDGTNGKEIAEWINETESLIGQSARNGGRYVSIITDGDSKNTATKTDWVVLYSEGFFGVLPHGLFVEQHTISKTHKILV